MVYCLFKQAFAVMLSIICWIIYFHLCTVTAGEHCFAELKGNIDDTEIDVEQVDVLNNLKILPRLRSLLQKDYFHYFQVRLNKGCPFFANDYRCGLRHCRIQNCSEEDIPFGLLEPETDRKKAMHKYSREVNEGVADVEVEGEDAIDCELSQLDSSLSTESQEIIAGWTKHDDADDNTFCEVDDDNPSQLTYVDLLKNPERYTGYRGPSSTKIWDMIYRENCFFDHSQTPEIYAALAAEQCLEKRVFFRTVSGLHSSISIHLSYIYPLSTDMVEDGSVKWGPNVEEFRKRFDPQHMEAGPSWLRNLYFTYLLELRALAKAAPYLRRQQYYTGNIQEDADTKAGVDDLLLLIEREGNLFDETQLFRGDPNEAEILRREFRNHFRNISRIMDCVGCEKCRLWGKLQTQGMGTALKILFSPSSYFTDPSTSKFQLRRTEIVALTNAFGRLSTSIGALREFCRLISSKT